LGPVGFTAAGGGFLVCAASRLDVERGAFPGGGSLCLWFGRLTGGSLSDGVAAVTGAAGSVAGGGFVVAERGSGGRGAAVELATRLWRSQEWAVRPITATIAKSATPQAMTSQRGPCARCSRCPSD
jgi:hypothetical protein